MANYITIDGGTTNTRISLVQNLKVIGRLKFPVGARAGIGNGSILRETIKNGIEQLLQEYEMQAQEISCILAAGMITSEFGLYKLDHIIVPAGVAELNAARKQVMLEDVSEIPFVFVPGVKILSEDLCHTDMMRGEEAELIGLMKDGDGECVYILPGSHSKLVQTDEAGRIKEFSTMLTGEMIGALATETILKDAIDFGSKLNKEFLVHGMEYAAERGINEALFKVRVLKNLFAKNTDEVYSFFVGACLCDEVKAVLNTGISKVVIGGNAKLKEATGMLLSKEENLEIVIVSEDEVENSSTMGMIKIYEYNK